MRCDKVMKKIIVICVIFLFIGVVFQPVLAGEASITKKSDVNENCVECQPASRVDLLRVRLLVIRIKAITNVILSRFGYIPEVEEKCEEVLDVIHNNKILKHPEYPIICSILKSILYLVYIPYIPLLKIWEKIYEKKIGIILYPIMIFLLSSIIWFTFLYYEEYECEEWPDLQM